MGRVWSDENKFQKWLDVELAAAETLAEAGIVPREAALKLRERGRVDVARINELEAKVRHDVIAFTMAVQESVSDPEAARWLHYGLTSNDVVDTAQALLVREASQQIEKALERMGEVLERRAWEFKDTPQIGRTHGVHAEPITFGLKIANWFSENRRDLALRHPLSLDLTGQLSEDTLQSQRTAHLESECRIQLWDTVHHVEIGSEIPCQSASS